MVNKDGSIDEVRIIHHVGGGCDEEARRVIAAMPNWSPGYIDDEIGRVYFTQPIRFKLD